MSSILSGDFKIKVDNEYLKTHGWNCFYSSDKLATKFVNGNLVKDYHPNQIYWRWQDVDYNSDHFYSGYLYYFPEKFIGNTKEIIGVNENPRGYVYIYIDNLDNENYKERFYVQSAEDIELAKSLLYKFLEEENKKTWSYGWKSKYTKF